MAQSNIKKRLSIKEEFAYFENIFKAFPLVISVAFGDCSGYEKIRTEWTFNEVSEKLAGIYNLKQ